MKYTQSERLQQFFDKLMLSKDRQTELKKMTNERLVDLLIEKVWADYSILSFESDLIDEVINRLDPTLEKELDKIYGEKRGAAETIESMPIIHDQAIHEAMEDLQDGSSDQT